MQEGTIQTGLLLYIISLNPELIYAGIGFKSIQTKIKALASPIGEELRSVCITPCKLLLWMRFEHTL